MSEPVLALRWLNSILRPELVAGHVLAALIGGFNLVPPPGTPSPYGIIRPMTAQEDITGLEGAVLVWSPQIVQVNLYDRDPVRKDYSALDPLAGAIYTLLNGKDGAITGGVIHGCKRLTIEANHQEVGGEVERYINQQFIIEATAS